MRFTLKAPCDNCPFLKGTTMVLREGRMQGIVERIEDDYNVFPCHKHTHGTEDEDSGEYQHDERDQACMGALAYSLKHQRNIPVMARLAIRAGETNIHRIAEHFDRIEDPGEWEIG